MMNSQKIEITKLVAILLVCFLTTFGNQASAQIRYVKEIATGTGDGSSWANAFFLIFTCTCGIADCGGWDKIAVNHNENTIMWNFDYNEIRYRYEFNKMYYKGEIERISFELNQKKIELSPEHILFPE